MVGAAVIPVFLSSQSGVSHTRLARRSRGGVTPCEATYLAWQRCSRMFAAVQGGQY